MNPIFCMVFAGNCHACINFKSKYLDDLRAGLKEYPAVTPIEYNVSKIGDSLPNDAPKDLNRFIKFYPCFILIPGSSWNASKHNPLTQLKNILIYGATVNSEGKVIILPTTQANRESLMEWIRNNVEHDSNLKSGDISCVDQKGKMIPTEGSVCSFKILSKR